MKLMMTVIRMTVAITPVTMPMADRASAEPVGYP